MIPFAFRRRSFANATVALLLGAPAVAAQCKRVGVERWVVKTTAPIRAQRPHRFDVSEFGQLAAPSRIDDDGERALVSRYRDATTDGLREGQLVAVRGWVQLIKTAPDDCDYHIQITPDQAGRTGTVIVEIPMPDASHVRNKALRGLLTRERGLIRNQLRLAREPGTVHIDGRAYMEFVGALFFDGPHYPHCDARGSGTPAVTCWEVHPVISSRFVPRPSR
jgi:hypothetical protein